MGMWESARGHVSDEMAVILGDAFKRIGMLSMKPIMAHLTDAIECATRDVKGIEEMTFIISDALARLAALPSRPTLTDVADGIEFASRGSLLVEIAKRPGKTPAFNVSLHPAADELRLMSMFVAKIGEERCFKTIPNRGQIQRRKE